MADCTQRRVLVTRPEPGLADTLEALTHRGWSAHAAPMLTIHRSALRGPHTYDRVIVTSGQSLEPLRDRMALDTPLTTVGTGTAARARALGFTQVDAAQGTAESLISHLDRIPLAERRALSLLLATGSGLGFDLAAALRLRGWQVTRRVVYRAQPVGTLDPATRTLIETGQIGTILFYSAVTAATFVKALGPQRNALATIRALALSPQVARPLSIPDWNTVAIAPYPDQTALLDLLGPSPLLSGD